jgi:uncharacterized protein YjdB
MGLAACSTATDVQTVSRISVAPSSATVLVHDQKPLQASLFDGSGGTVSGPSVFWSTEDSSVALVSSGGVVTAMAPGVVRIAASAEGVYGVATITVPVTVVALVTVVPDTLHLAPGEASRLLATAYDASGNIINGLTITWGSTNTAVATVDQTGAVTAVADGESTIGASMGGQIGSATAVVSTPKIASVVVAPDTLNLTTGASGQLVATAYDASGGIVTGLPVTWQSADPKTATVDTAGNVAGVRKGATSVSATIGGKSGVATVIVTTAPPGT